MIAQQVLQVPQVIQRNRHIPVPPAQRPLFQVKRLLIIALRLIKVAERRMHLAQLVEGDRAPMLGLRFPQGRLKQHPGVLIGSVLVGLESTVIL